PKMIPLVLTSHFRPLNRLAQDLAAEGPSDWPQVIFIEPDYYDSPVHIRGACDNHAPLAMAPGERFLAEVYRTLSSSRQRWKRTVLIVTYDEHGGCFDHVPPLPVTYRNPNGVAFETTGPRVPTIVVGPFAPSGVSHARLDHTSILQLLAERFGKPGEAYSPEVSDRKAQHIESVSAVLSLHADNATPRTLPSVVPRGRKRVAPTPIIENNLHHAFVRAAQDLAVRHKTEAFAKFPPLKQFVDPQTPDPAHMIKAKAKKPVKPSSSMKPVRKRAAGPARKPKRRS
ncbi:MAG: hypothetical protein OEY28_13925, partial [Nitrospira sp.]|nr:hypothetical protein [Nitrospira sp.]